jgi:hypothetical protein
LTDRPRIFVYKLTTDNGGAPAVYRRRLSLAICKGAIRASAEVGDWVVGVAADSLRSDTALIYLAQVDAIMEQGTYYASPSLRGRPDAIYEWKRGRLRVKPDAPFHGPEHASNDIGDAPPYPRARVLLSSRYRYYGRSASDWYGAVAPLALRTARAITQGHRVNHADDVYRAWEKVIKVAMKRPQERVVPTDLEATRCRHK